SLPKRNAGASAHLPQRRHSFSEQIRSGFSAGMPGDQKVRLEAEESAITRLKCVFQDRLELAISFSSWQHLPIGASRVLDMKVRGERLERRPVAQRIFAALDEVREVESAAQLRGIHRRHEIDAAAFDVAVDVALVFMNECNAS